MFGFIILSDGRPILWREDSKKFFAYIGGEQVRFPFFVVQRYGLHYDLAKMYGVPNGHWNPAA